MLRNRSELGIWSEIGQPCDNCSWKGLSICDSCLECTIYNVMCRTNQLFEEWPNEVVSSGYWPVQQTRPTKRFNMRSVPNMCICFACLSLSNRVGLVECNQRCRFYRPRRTCHYSQILIQLQLVNFFTIHADSFRGHADMIAKMVN